MGLQPHQLNRTRESKRRTQLNHAGLQHQTHHKYFGSSRFNCQNQELEVALQDQSLAFLKMDLFKAEIRVCFLPN